MNLDDDLVVIGPTCVNWRWCCRFAECQNMQYREFCCISNWCAKCL